MSSTLAHARCFNHPQREAAARCLGCRHDLCRECVIEHEGRLLCSSCLGAETRSTERAPRHLLRGLLRTVATLLGFLLIWMLLFAAGDLISRMPAEYHETTGTRP